MSSNIIIIGLQGKDPIDIVSGMLDELVPEADACDGFKKYKWQINNKYYEADVFFCCINEENLSTSLVEASEAVIIHIDPFQESALLHTNELVNKYNFNNLHMKLLVCDGFLNEDSYKVKEKVQEWCIDGGWELVELSIESSEVSEDDLEDDFVDSWGYKRIKQALHAHTWMDLKLKNDRTSCDEVGELLKEMTLVNKETSIPYNSLHSQSDNSSESRLQEIKEEDDFSALFSSFGEMKEKADALPSTERRLYAEKVALAFLRSMGDDDSGEDIEAT